MGLSSAVESFISKSLSNKKFEVVALAGDASSRRYYRIVEDDYSWVLMSWEPFQDDGHYPFLSVLRHFDKHDVHVPKVKALSPELGVILLEDLGDLTLERKFWENQDPQAALPFYKQAIDELLKMHYPSSADQADCTAFKISFNTERLLWEMNYGREHLMEKLSGIVMTDTIRKELDKSLLEICQRLDAEPKFIAHRDYHSRNLMIKLGKMRVIDFQDARLGAIQYDLVSLLKDSYVNLPDSMAEQLVSYYLDGRTAYLPEKISSEKFWEVYELQSIQRCFKACGSFASFFNLRNDTRYLKYLPKTLQRVKKSTLKFPQYKVLVNILEDNGVFARKFDL